MATERLLTRSRAFSPTATRLLRGDAGAPASTTPAVRVRLDSLLLAGSPRLGGENRAHTRALAALEEPLPPIVVDRGTRRVLDGLHRVRAAMRRGDSTIDAVFFDGDAQAGFVYAVKANLTGGLPLSLADRRAAAKRMLAYYPQWSDRAIAVATDLSPTTVGGIRRRAAEHTAPLKARVGRDGRIRPVDFAEGRRRAAKVVAERPGASLREVAEAAGVSVATARDVRRRLQASQDPVPPGRGAAHQLAGPAAPVAPAARSVPPLSRVPVEPCLPPDSLERAPAPPGSAVPGSAVPGSAVPGSAGRGSVAPSSAGRASMGLEAQAEFGAAARAPSATLTPKVAVAPFPPPGVSPAAAGLAGVEGVPLREIDHREVMSILKDLSRDPALRYSKVGRDLIRWLGGRALADDDWSQVVEVVPPHCAYPIAELAVACASAWGEFAETLLARARAAKQESG